MRKITTLIFAGLLLCSLSAWSQTNLFDGWNGYDALGEGSQPNNHGWGNTATSPAPSWNTTNGSGGIRFMEPGNGEYNDYYFPAKDPNDPEVNRYNENRILWVRWGDGNVPVGQVYTYSLNTVAGRTYTFSWKYCWHNNASVPTLTVSFCKNADGTGVIASKQFKANDTKRILTEGSLSFQPCEGAVYMTIGSNSGALCAIADLSLVEGGTVDGDPFMKASVPSLFLLKGLGEEYSMKAFDVTAFLPDDLYMEDIAVTAPEGITLDRSVIELWEVTCGGTAEVVVTYTGTTAIDDSIVITCGDLRQVVQIKARPEVTGGNLIEYWSGDGFTGAGSEPNNFAWIGSNVTSWGKANDAGIRYQDKVYGTSDYKYFNEEKFVGRIFFSRWDGQGGSDKTTVYAYPVKLKAGHSYTFSGFYAWNSNAVDDGVAAEFKIDINASADATGVSLADNTYSIEDVSTARLVLNEMYLDFTPTSDGIYYLTVRNGNEKAILGALADLSIIDNAAPSITTSVMNYLAFTSNYQERTPSHSFTVMGSNLSENVTLKAPKGITLDKTSLTAAEVNAGATVTATYNGGASISSGVIEITSGSVSTKVRVYGTAVKEFNADKLYYIIHSSGKYLGKAEDDGVKILEPAVDETEANKVFRFVPVEGDIYNIQETATDTYLARGTANDWTMIWGDESMVVDAYAQFIVELIDATNMRIKCVGQAGIAPKQFLGTDNTDISSLVYADKQATDTKHYWVVKATDGSDVTIKNISAGNKNNLSVYPTVTTGKLNINAAEGTKISIYNIAGSKVLEVVLKDQSVNVTSLSAGLYIISTPDGGKAKFIKK